MASAEFSEESKQKRPNVQMGDPFLEKLLLEACLEAMQTGAIVGIQDMGAAGLTCSTCEMGGRGGLWLLLFAMRHRATFELVSEVAKPAGRGLLDCFRCPKGSIAPIVDLCHDLGDA